MLEAKSHNDDFFIKNAMACWLFHFPEHKWTPIYNELIKKDYIEKPAPKPRPARRRKPKTAV